MSTIVATQSKSYVPKVILLGQFCCGLVDELPLPMHHWRYICAGHTANLVEGEGYPDPLIYIFGGGNDEVSYSTLYIVNMRTREWFLVSRATKEMQKKLQYPFERECHASVVRKIKDKPTELVIFGGLTDMETRLDDLWKYSLADREWTMIVPKTPLKPDARETHSAIYCTRHDSIVIFGGWSGEATRLDDIFEFSFVTQEWTKLPQFDTKGNPCSFIRSAHSAIYKESTNSMVVFGGWDGTQRFNSMIEYFFDTNTWKEVVPNNHNDPYNVPGARTGHRAQMTSAETMLISGGFNGKEKYFDLFEFSFASNIWRRIELAPAAIHKEFRETFRGSQYHSLTYSDQMKRVVFYGSDGKKQRMYEMNLMVTSEVVFKNRLKQSMHYKADVEFVFAAEESTPQLSKQKTDTVVTDDGKAVKKRKLT